MSLINIMRQTARIVDLVLPDSSSHGEAWCGCTDQRSLLSGCASAFGLMRAPAQENLGAARLALSSIGEGIRFVRNTQILFSTMLLDFLGTFFASASALLPIFANEILRLDPGGWECCIPLNRWAPCSPPLRCPLPGMSGRKGPSSCGPS